MTGALQGRSSGWTQLRHGASHCCAYALLYGSPHGVYEVLMSSRADVSEAIR